MSISLEDLFGDTLLVAREPATGGNLKNSLENTELRNTEDRKRNEEEEKRGEEREEELDEENAPRKSLGDLTSYSLVTKDGVVLDLANTRDLADPDVVVGLYFTSSTLADCRWGIRAMLCYIS